MYLHWREIVLISYSDLSRHYRELFRLATPIVLARSGIIVMSTVDMIMVGRFSSDEIAFLSIGYSLIMPMVVIGLGLLTGTLVLTANRFGAGEAHCCGGIWRASLPYALFIGLIGLVISQAGEFILLAFSQSDELVSHGGRIMQITGLGLPAFMVLLTTAFFLEGIKRPVPWMIVMIVANVVNLILNWIFIFGALGMQPMGAEGAAWATTIARYLSVFLLVGYVLWMRDHQVYSVRGRIWAPLRIWARQRRIGFAASICLSTETISFAIINIFAGWIGVLPLAAFGITFNLITMVFMVTLGLGAATSVRVGIAHGAGKHADLAWSGWTGLGVNTISMVGLGILFFLFADLLAGVFTQDPLLIQTAAPMIAFTGIILVVDGGQGIMINALRGRQDIWIPSIIQLFAFFVIMIPAVYFIAFSAKQGAMGLMEGILIGSLLSSVLLIWRFYLLTLDDAGRKSVLARSYSGKT